MTDDADLRLLVLMRHAEAKESSPDGDAGRELSKTGRKAATRMGEWLVGQGLRPDVVVLSPSRRTVQTWEQLREGGVRCSDVWSDAAVYEADVEDLVESIGAVPDEATTLVLIGHAPAVPQLALDLPDHLEEGAAPHPGDGWPSGSLAVVGHRGPWSTFPSDESALVSFVSP